jgi:hypothetical protein
MDYDSAVQQVALAVLEDEHDEERYEARLQSLIRAIHAAVNEWIERGV